MSAEDQFRVTAAPRSPASPCATVPPFGPLATVPLAPRSPAAAEALDDVRPPARPSKPEACSKPPVWCIPISVGKPRNELSRSALGAASDRKSPASPRLKPLAPPPRNSLGEKPPERNPRLL